LLRIDSFPREDEAPDEPAMAGKNEAAGATLDF
jgi:hypothetical protein